MALCRCKAYHFPHRSRSGRCGAQEAAGDAKKAEADLRPILSAARLLVSLRALRKDGGAPSWPGHGALTAFDHHPRIHQEAHEYMQTAKLPYKPLMTPPPVDLEHHKRISAAYDSAKHDPSNPEVAASYGALKRETAAQFKFLKQKGYRFEPIGPNASAGGVASTIDSNPETSDFHHVNQDIRNNKHLHVFVGGDMPPDHPLAEATGDPDFPTYNDMFRAVHDVFGHAKIGVDFGQHGEDYAYRSHATMFSPEAQRALANETRGQNTNFHYGRNREHNYANPAQAIFPEQKASLLPHWAND